MPVVAEGIVLTCLEPAKDAIGSLTDLIKYLQTTTDAIGTLSDCGINIICYTKVIIETRAVLLQVSMKIVTIATTFQSIVPATETCLTKAVAVTLTNEAQKIGATILNC